MAKDAGTRVVILRSSFFSSRWFCGAVADFLFQLALWRALIAASRLCNDSGKAFIHNAQGLIAKHTHTHTHIGSRYVKPEAPKQPHIS